MLLENLEYKQIFFQDFEWWTQLLAVSSLFHRPIDQFLQNKFQIFLMFLKEQHRLVFADSRNIQKNFDLSQKN